MKMKYNDKRVTIFSIIIIIILTIWIAFTSFKYKENHNRNVEAQGHERDSRRNLG